ncbi:equilibrative nucleotide transporter 2-like [Zingiber officinale]|uniref:equilibrative nucleotide transporter 2-like n=1 Tax=Zingiber officinale TaxID=94328 RepID=UPI001C4D2F06|nr:equilibrative nucleotide transporter 2-like [Zingiber officinale]
MSTHKQNWEHYKTKGRFTALFISWLLGNGSLFAWNSMLTIGDYYAFLFPRYHPTRILTLVYQPFALGTTAILAYHEATLNTRRRNLLAYSLFFSSSLGLLMLDLATSGKGGLGIFIGVIVLSQDSSLFVLDLQVFNSSEFLGVGRIDLRLKRAGLFIEPRLL